MTNETQIALARELESKLRDAVAANDALIEFERTTPLNGPRLAFPLSADQFARWAAHIGAIEAGTRNVDL